MPVEAGNAGLSVVVALPVGEQPIPQFLVEARVTAADPFGDHGGMFLLFIADVLQDSTQLWMLAGR